MYYPEFLENMLTRLPPECETDIGNAFNSVASCEGSLSKFEALDLAIKLRQKFDAKPRTGDVVAKKKNEFFQAPPPKATNVCDVEDDKGAKPQLRDVGAKAIEMPLVPPAEEETGAAGHIGGRGAGARVAPAAERWRRCEQ
jgi:hypothetical protein